MSKTVWYALVLVLALTFVGAAGVSEAQYHGASGYHGVPAQPYHGNGYDRHIYNGYVGVNYRHYSPHPMKMGTGPYYGYGTPVYYRPYYGGYYGGCPYPPVYPGRYGGVRVHVQGTYIGNGVAVSGGATVRR